MNRQQIREFRADVHTGDRIRVYMGVELVEGYVAGTGFGLTLSDKPSGKPLGILDFRGRNRYGATLYPYFFLHPEYIVLARA